MIKFVKIYKLNNLAGEVHIFEIKIRQCNKKNA